ncbi:50S ribosomal protein L19, chloroplastic [Morella rubra]|uniref:50S ribosomal protein L19, chloroplastic n=1 Tax=Morella rubra TaxID=262757 RepID=A0A6A1WHL4_9ROSI|nr:50S ribosomal protein L19, chloroplastic [Morella rubra]
MRLESVACRGSQPWLAPLTSRWFSTAENRVESDSHDSSASIFDVAPRIKFKRLDKTAKNIMQILDKEAVEDVKQTREIPDIKPGYIVQLKVEVPENKRRVSIVKGIVIARRNAGLNTTFRLRRLVAGVGIESLFPLYSPNIKEIKVLDKKKVRRAKLYYLRDRMNALK